MSRAAPAATALRVHPNTLRYRLRRIGEVSGLDLGDPQSRFAATIALRLAEAHRPFTPAAGTIAADRSLHRNTRR